MRDTILIAPDKFKGTLTADEACDIIADALRSYGIRRLNLCPMADGGDGTPSSLAGLNVIVSHDIIGPQCFPSIPVMQRSSFDLGCAIKKELLLSDKFYVGLGGTATTDGGAGILQALGADFYDKLGRLVESHITPQILPGVSRITLPTSIRNHLTGRATILSDVYASLYGPGLSSLDFAAQKGASESDIRMIEDGLRNLTKLLEIRPFSPCDGAAGGVGYALASVCGARCTSGAEEILANKEIDWNRISLIISGEGCIDNQTAGGKVPETLRLEAAKRGTPYIAIGGYVTPEMLRLSTPECSYISCIESPDLFNPQEAQDRLYHAIDSHIDLIRSLILNPLEKGIN